jgi:hypothetical protein
MVARVKVDLNVQREDFHKDLSAMAEHHKASNSMVKGLVTM